MSTVIIPTVGQAYNFTLNAKYSYANGIYRVKKLMTYEEYVNSRHNILEAFYSPGDLTQEDVDQDLPYLRTSVIIEVGAPDEDSSTIVECIPLCFVYDTPDHNVHRYHKFGLITYCGLTNNIDQFDYLKENVKNMFSACLGISPDPFWVDVGYVWMTEAEYEAQQSHQEEQAKQVVNYYTENIRLQAQYNSVNVKFNSYEEIILNQEQQIAQLKETIEDLKQQLGATNTGDN